MVHEHTSGKKAVTALVDDDLASWIDDVTESTAWNESQIVREGIRKQLDEIEGDE